MTDSIRSITAWLSSRAPLRSERGATALEYAIVASFIAAVIVISVAYLGRTTNDNFVCTGSSYATRSAEC